MINSIQTAQGYEHLSDQGIIELKTELENIKDEVNDKDTAYIEVQQP